MNPIIAKGSVVILGVCDILSCQHQNNTITNLTVSWASNIPYNPF